MAPILRAGAAAAAVLVAVGGYAAMGWLDFHGPRGLSWLGLVVGLLATALGVGVAMAVGRHIATGVLLLLVLPFCGFFIHDAAEALVLTARGVSADCHLADVRKTARHVRDGSEEDGPPTSTIYTHRLRCPTGGPSEMFTETAAGRPGTDVSITWDPRHRAAPLPSASVPGHSELVLPAVAVLFALLLAATADPAAFRRRRGRVRPFVG